MNFDNDLNYEFLSNREKLNKLFEQQKHILDCFLERGAISKKEYDKSMDILKEKINR